MIEWFIAWLSLQRDDYPQRKLQLNQQFFSETFKAVVFASIVICNLEVIYKIQYPYWQYFFK